MEWWTAETPRAGQDLHTPNEGASVISFAQAMCRGLGLLPVKTVQDKQRREAVFLHQVFAKLPGDLCW